MKLWSWGAWQLDPITWGWIGWLAFAAGLETVALRWYPGQELTAHLRPVFLAYPVTWWLAFGAWLWIGVHLLAPAVERGLLNLVRG